MTDYIYKDGVSGPFRHASGGLGARNGFPWIGHPRDRVSQSPQQPRFELSGAPWIADLTEFQAAASAPDFARALKLVQNGGFTIQTSDVPEPVRDAFIAWAAQNCSRVEKAEYFSGVGWQ